MPLTVSKCPLCADPRSVLFDQREFRGYQVSNQLCLNCGLVYQSPRMDEDELKYFYQTEYRKVYQGSNDPTQIDLTVQSKRADALLEILEKSNIVNVDRHLDIGCSSGIFLERVASRYQCLSVGVEPGETYRNHAKKRGVMVYDNLENVKQAGEKKFDLITMIHVLEHLPNPVVYLKNLKDTLLESDGIILIEVPNLFAHDSFEIAHLTSFSRFTLEETLRKAGYKKKFLIRHGRPRSLIIPLYLTMLAEPKKGSPGFDKVNKERGIRVKRRAGMIHRRIVQRLFPKQAWLPEFRIELD
jgi:2-polyprenyl-3-methyl-5-hydroxy-6-metoxy-1,4-benzoquinol methylase